MYDRAHYILQKTYDRARRDRYKNVKLQLNSKGCHGLNVCRLYTMSQNVMTQSTALDTVIYSTLHTAAARKGGVHKKI
jgi:hypothetical protein